MLLNVQQREIEDVVREKDEKIETLHEHVNDREERIKGLLVDLQQADAAANTQNEAILTLKEEITFLNSRLASEKVRIREESEGEMQHLKQELTYLKDRNLQLETLLEKSNAKAAAVEQQLKKLESQSVSMNPGIQESIKGVKGVLR
jgi:chromosome segregation ATPase